ncbi:MAG: glycoside hydrolase family 13 protein [Blautia massiliensis (ex Durand et al. 2017)]
MMDFNKKDWWKEAVIYQIYPKSFQDSDGDGVGDLPGIIRRLDYLQTLGVDALWLCPVFASPQADNGYDISDYCAIDPMFGTLDDMRALIREGKKRGIGTLLDLVLNHTSDQHRWFREALKGKDNPYHDYYIWRDGTPDALPNGMRATFGGPAWTWVPELGQYYFHQFAPQQPDLNWANPKVRQELYAAVRFWMREGVAGFRLDVIDQVGKDPDLQVTANGPRLMEFLRELNRETFGGANLVTVGEAWGADIPRARQYSAPDGSIFSMVFQFEQMVLDQGPSKWEPRPMALPDLKKSIARWQNGLHGCGWNSLFWNNHDLPRIVSRWGDDGAYRVQSAKALAVALHGLQGTPYIYQGEELGMTNAAFPLEDLRDIESLNAYKDLRAQGKTDAEAMAAIHRVGRDNARTPMQWTAGPNAGFTTGTPWMRVNPNHTAVNAEAALADPDSVFHTYQKLIALRKAYPVFVEGDFTLLCPDDEQVFAYVRRGGGQVMLVAVNLSGRPAAFPLPEEFAAATPLLATAGAPVPGTLRPWEALLYCQPAD